MLYRLTWILTTASHSVQLSSTNRRPLARCMGKIPISTELEDTPAAVGTRSTPKRQDEQRLCRTRAEMRQPYSPKQALRVSEQDDIRELI